MDWKKPLKGFVIPLVVGGIFLGIFNVTAALRSGSSLPMAVVDVSPLIREAAAGFARGRLSEAQNPMVITKRLETYKESLTQKLTEFARKNHCLVFTANQVFGDIPDMTEAFMAFLEEEKPQ